MAEESTMRQAMKSWLKDECITTGEHILSLRNDVQSIINEMARQELRPTKIEHLQTPIRWVFDTIDLLYEKNDITESEYHDLRTRLQDVEGHLPTSIKPEIKPSERYEILKQSRWEADRLIDRVETIMFEKVVECQSGKPGEPRVGYLTPEQEATIRREIGGPEKWISVYTDISGIATIVSKDKAIRVDRDGNLVEGESEPGLGETGGIITDTFDVAKRRIKWLYDNQFASFLLYKDSIDEAIEDKEAGKVPAIESLKPFTLDELRSLKKYADELYYKKE